MPLSQQSTRFRVPAESSWGDVGRSAGQRSSGAASCSPFAADETPAPLSAPGSVKQDPKRVASAFDDSVSWELQGVVLAAGGRGRLQ